KHQRAQIACPRRAEDAPPKASPDEPRQISTMIEVRMREDDGVDAPGIDRQRRPVALSQLFEPLKQAAVDQHLMVAQIEQMLRPGDGSRGSEKGERRHRLTILDPW